MAAIGVSDPGCEECCKGGLHKTKVKLVLVKAVSNLSAGVRGWGGVGEVARVRAVTRAKLIAARKRPTPGNCDACGSRMVRDNQRQIRTLPLILSQRTVISMNPMTCEMCQGLLFGDIYMATGGFTIMRLPTTLSVS